MKVKIKQNKDLEPEIRIYTTFEVAEILKQKVVTIRKYVREGSLKGYKTGKQTFIKHKDLVDFINSRESGKIDYEAKKGKNPDQETNKED